MTQIIRLADHQTTDVTFWGEAVEVIAATHKTIDEIEWQRLKKRELLEGLGTRDYVVDDMCERFRANDTGLLLDLLDTASSAIAIAPDGRVELQSETLELIKKHYGRNTSL